MNTQGYLVPNENRTSDERLVGMAGAHTSPCVPSLEGATIVHTRIRFEWRVLCSAEVRDCTQLVDDSSTVVVLLRSFQTIVHVVP